MPTPADLVLDPHLQAKRTVPGIQLPETGNPAVFTTELP